MFSGGVVFIQYAQRAMEDGGFGTERNLYDSAEFSDLQRHLRHANNDLRRRRGSSLYRRLYGNVRVWRVCLLWLRLVFPAIYVSGLLRLSDLLSISVHIWSRRRI